MRLLESKPAKAVGWVLWKLNLRKINNHARAIFGVPDNEWAPWAPRACIEESDRLMLGARGGAPHAIDCDMDEDCMCRRD